MLTFPRTFLFVLVLLLTALPGRAQEAIDIPAVIGYRNAGQVDIEVISPDATVQALARRAFHIHGAFRLVAGEGVSLRLELTPDGARAVRVNLSGQSNLSGRYEGATLSQAVLRACDAVVEQVVEIPGFFSGQLAFVSHEGRAREIYLGDLLFQRVRPLTQDRSQAVTPQFSPDGRFILYTTYFRSGFPDLYLIDLETGRKQVYASYRGTNTGGAFSPDGRRTALTLSSPGNPELFIGSVPAQKPRRLTRNNSIESSPSWSPDGSRIVLSSDKDYGRPQLYVTNVRNGAMRRVATNVSGYCAEPDWNPRVPNLVAFTASVGGNFQIAVYDFDNGKSEVLGTGRGDNVEPVWVNDGRHIIFTKRIGSQEQLHIHDIVTGETAPLHSDRFSFSQASFANP